MSGKIGCGEKIQIGMGAFELCGNDYYGEPIYCERCKVIDKITATDTIFGFGAWLTSRKEAVTFSYKHDAGKMCDLIKEYLEANNLGDVSTHYPNNLVMPKESNK